MGGMGGGGEEGSDLIAVSVLLNFSCVFSSFF